MVYLIIENLLYLQLSVRDPVQLLPLVPLPPPRQPDLPPAQPLLPEQCLLRAQAVVVTSAS